MPDLCVADPGRTAPHSVLRPGLSIGDTVRMGTLGLFVVDASGTLCLLTARHVIAPAGAKATRPVLHPAETDAPGSARKVATLWWWSPRVDAALARIEPGVVAEVQQLQSGQVVRSFREPRVGDVLEKSGRTTGMTRARVTDVRRPADGLPNAFILERLDGDDGAISCEGDSGALWYDPSTGEGVGLHHGGEPDDGKAVAVSLVLIKSAWDIEPWNGDFLDGPEVGP